MEKGSTVGLDTQGNLTEALGFHEPENLPVSLVAMLEKSMKGKPYEPNEDFLYYHEGIDLMPVNTEFSNNRSDIRQYDE